MDFKDYYKILGLERGADQKAISGAYRKLARKHHPDVNKEKGAEDRFKEINEAYQVLGKPEQRAKYDQMYEAYQHGGVDWQQLFGRGGGYQQAPGGWTVTFGGDAAGVEEMLGGLGGFSDFFRQFFGGDVAPSRGRGRRGRTGTAAGEDFSRAAPPARAEATIDVTLEDAFHGAQKSLALQLNGAPRRIDVTIPKGVRSGQRIRLPGALDGGDLYLTVKILPHARFERRDDDLVTEVPVALTDAVLGTTIEVPTLGGTVEMTIPPETQNGQLFRLRGEGMPRARVSERGDQLVRVKVLLPARLSPRERELFEELKRLRTQKTQ